ncbi:MAG: sugar phosphate isomerase/epimerase family protein [Clostridia bacterium]
MKLAFSTLGCPRWTMTDIVTTAKDLGFNGVEIRGLREEMYAPNIKDFSKDKIEATKAMFGKNFSICMLTSSCCIADYSQKDSVLNEAFDYINLAQQLGVKYVRIMCTNKASKDGGDYTLAVKNYKAILDYAKNTSVTPLIETNGMFVESALLKKFVEEVGGNAGVLWDIHHPYRFGGESIDTTLANIGKYIKYCHIKDSVVENGETQHKMLGYGDVPVKYAVLKLKELGFDGFITLEWVKRWNKNLEEPGIVFSHYIDYIKRLI